VVAVEAALTIPILVVLVFGIIDWTLALRDQVEIVSVTRAAARGGAALAPDAVVVGNPGVSYPARSLTGPNVPVVVPPANPPSYGSQPFTQQVADIVEAAASALPKNSIDFMLVYRANANGFPGARTSFGSDPSDACVGAESTCDLYVWNDSTSDFNNTSGTPWQNDTINACRDEAHSIGVFIQANHRMITPIFGRTVLDRLTGTPLPGKYSVQTAYTVMKFEPRLAQVNGVVQCKRV
jgi:hypothetical protein